METGQYACMSKDTDEFRKQAEDCRKFAALSLNDSAFWLELAEDWTKLAQEGDLGLFRPVHKCSGELPRRRQYFRCPKAPS